MNKIILETVKNVVNINIDTITINNDNLDEDLIIYGLMSINYIRIIVSLEEEFKCEIPYYELSFNENNTVRKLYNLIEKLVD